MWPCWGTEVTPTSFSRKDDSPPIQGEAENLLSPVRTEHPERTRGQGQYWPGSHMRIGHLGPLECRPCPEPSACCSPTSRLDPSQAPALHPLSLPPRNPSWGEAGIWTSPSAPGWAGSQGSAPLPATAPEAFHRHLPLPLLIWGSEKHRHYLEGGPRVAAGLL